MITLSEDYLIDQGRNSSKGNQLKWSYQNRWYKADYTGYEGLAEYVISKLLTKSSLEQTDFVEYQLETIQYKNRQFQGCSSENFLKPGAQLITLERLFRNHYGKSLNQCIYQIRDVEQRLPFLVEQIERITGLKDFGPYMSQLLLVDAFFLNEDRHTHNIAVISNADGTYGYCPLFDQGAGLLSDIALDYPIDDDIYALMKTVKARTFSQDFVEQFDIAESLYGCPLTFHFSKQDVSEILENISGYSKEICGRVETVLRCQIDKYQPYFGV